MKIDISKEERKYLKFWISGIIELISKELQLFSNEPLIDYSNKIKDNLKAKVHLESFMEKVK